MKLNKLSYQCASCQVAPRAGAWIETTRVVYLSVILMRSPPVRGRGLKHLHNISVGRLLQSPPVRGRGLKRLKQPARRIVVESPPVRGRGLKLR